MPEGKRLVSILKSANPKAHYYIGFTHDVPARLADHNAGRCRHAALRARNQAISRTNGLPGRPRNHAVISSNTPTLRVKRAQIR